MRLALDQHTISTALGLLTELPLDVNFDDQGVVRFEDENTVTYWINFDRYSLMLDINLPKSEINFLDALDSAIRVNQSNLSKKCRTFRHTLRRLSIAMHQHRQQIQQEAFLYLRPFAKQRKAIYQQAYHIRCAQDAPRYERLKRIEQWIARRQSKKVFRNAHRFPHCGKYFLFLLAQYAPHININALGLTQNSVLSFNQSHE